MSYFSRKKQEYLALDARDRRRFWTDGLLNNALYILMAIFIIFTAVVNKNFLGPSSIVNIITLAAVSLPMALGIGGCIVLTGTDLSAGRVFGLAAGMSAAFLQNRAASKLIFEKLPATSGWWIIAVMLIVMLAGAVIGLVNGFFVAKFSLHPFIVTLATQLITYGIILMFFQINGNGGGPISNVAKEFKSAVSGPAFRIETWNVSIPWYVIFALVLVVIMWFVWNKTRFGKNMFAVGSNMEAAKVSNDERDTSPNTPSASSSLITVPLKEMSWSREESASRMPPSAPRAMAKSAFSSASMPSLAQTALSRATMSLVWMRRKSNRWQRDTMVGSTLSPSVVAKMKRT